MTVRRTDAVWIERFGGPEEVRLESLPVPALTADEVLVRMAAASVNPVDWKTVEGKYPMMGADKLPFALGRDLSGVIEEVGDGIEDWKVGTRVCAFIGHDRGAQGELVVVKREELVAVPECVDLIVAGALPLAAMTAWQGLFDHGRLEAGHSILIHGGAGGVGHLAVQFALWKGAIVYTTASANDLAFVRSLGVKRAIDYQSDRFEDVVGELDVVFDTQGGETQARSLSVLRKGGTLVSTLDPDVRKGAEMGVRTVPRWIAVPDPKALSQVIELIVSGTVKVTVTKTFPLRDVVAAQQFAQTEHPRGKIVLIGPVE